MAKPQMRTTGIWAVYSRRASAAFRSASNAASSVKLDSKGAASGASKSTQGGNAVEDGTPFAASAGAIVAGVVTRRIRPNSSM